MEPNSYNSCVHIQNKLCEFIKQAFIGSHFAHKEDITSLQILGC